MNLILGGGLTALLARDILGDGWTILPVGRSRKYSFRPALDDNWVIKDEAVDDYMLRYTLIPIYTKIMYSYAGQLTSNHAIALNPWLAKVYGAEIPPHAPSYWKTHTEYFSYGDCTALYHELHTKYNQELATNNTKWGKLESIDNHTITTTVGAKLEFKKMINTLPMPILLKALGLPSDLPARDQWCYHLRTDQLDFEGAISTHVVDSEIEFHKATKLDAVNYLFYSTVQIPHPGRLFMQFIRKFDLIGEVCVKDLIPCGVLPEFQRFTDLGIVNIGKAAAWDDCLDIGSSIKRLIKMKHV